VAEQSVWSTREHAAHPAAEIADLSVSDGVDAAVDRMQLAGRDPVIDRAPPETHRNQLAVRNDAVLPAGKVGYVPGTWVLSTMHFMVQSTQVPDLAPRGPAPAPGRTVRVLAE
jgi:hypothetical protein